MDAAEGWQYANHFGDPDDRWTPEQPPLLERLLSGTGAVSVGLSSSASGSNSRRDSGSSSSSARASQTWVRRRRWVRVIRRRLDIPPLPFLEPDGAMYHLVADGTLIPATDIHNDAGDHDGQELGSMLPTLLSSAQDYVARARYLVGTQTRDDMVGINVSAVETRRIIAKLERATTELRQGILSQFYLMLELRAAFLLFLILGDDDMERKTQAEVLLNTYSRDLERRRLSASAQGLLISGEGSISLFLFDSNFTTVF